VSSLICRECGKELPSFMDRRTHCPNCGSQNLLTPQQLAKYDRQRLAAWLAPAQGEKA
jgi:DNA-directed RNA polymerase subunit RPC12/RpoP